MNETTFEFSMKYSMDTDTQKKTWGRDMLHRSRDYMHHCTNLMKSTSKLECPDPRRASMDKKKWRRDMVGHLTHGNTPRQLKTSFGFRFRRIRFQLHKFFHVPWTVHDNEYALIQRRILFNRQHAELDTGFDDAPFITSSSHGCLNLKPLILEGSSVCPNNLKSLSFYNRDAV
jgi:hypothetical protein